MKSKVGLKIFVTDEENKPQKTIKNVVYINVFQNIKKVKLIFDFFN